MIENWDLISRIDEKTGNTYFSLVIDGTERDAQLMAKKLAGYVGSSIPAEPPFVYCFELPVNLDEITQDKIREAAREVVELTGKVNEFMPGGVLGDPLFNNPVPAENKEFPSFLTLNPSESFFATPHTPEQPKENTPIDLDAAKPLCAAENLPEKPAQPAITENNTTLAAKEVSSAENTPADPVTEEVSPTENTLPEAPKPEENFSPQQPPAITDQDMLISDMEDTLLGKNPVALEDIFAAETKYDMFVDVQNELKTQKNQTQREEKLNQVNAENTDSFDIFSQNLKEQTNIIDLTNLQEMLDKMPAEKEDTSAAQEKVEQFEKQTVDMSEQKTDIPVAIPHVNTVQDLPEITLRIAPLQNNQNSSPVEDPLAQIEQADREAGVQQSADSQAPKNTPLPEEENLVEKETFMEDKNAKTTFRIKPKIKIPPAVRQPQPPKPVSPRPPLPKAPAAPKPNVPNVPNVPAAPVAPSTPAAPATVEPNLEKTKTIDHSIQLPLSELKKHTWPLEIPLIPTYTLNNMVMSVNRFAHATAISVIESPGKLYNPLVFHGSTGTGKTHFLNAMAYAFSQKFGQPNIFMTNGVRLSRGVQRYIMEGKIEKFDQFMSTVKVLLIDDIHLLAINEQNRAYISKLLNNFLKERKQIVITSKYPPESLEKLEELIKFKLDSGWISELKPATGSAYIKIVKKMLLDNNVDLTDTQMDQFFAAKHMTLGTVMRSIRRLKALENLLPTNLNVEKRSQATILEKLIPIKGEDTSSRILSMDASAITSITQQGNGEWGRIGFFYPANCSDQMNWLVYALQQRAKELGIQSNFEIVVRSSYATENIISSAFKIANLCDNKKLKGAVILGPKPGTCDPSVRENFYDILTHMLEVMLIRCGIINFEDVRAPSTYVKLLAELMR